MRILLRRAFKYPTRGVLRLLLCALSAFAVAGAVSSLRLMAEAEGPQARFDLHAATKLERTHRRLSLFDTRGIERIKELVPAVLKVSPYFESSRATLERTGDLFELYSLAYVHPDFFDMGDIELVAGSVFGWDEVEFGDRVALISEGVAKQIFPATDAVGQNLMVMPYRTSYQVIGVYQRTRTGPGPGLILPPSGDSPFSTLAVLAEPGRANEVRRHIVEAARSVYAEQLREAGFPPGNDFLLNSAGEFGSEANPIRRTLTSLAFMGAISLVVAGMGVFSMATIEVSRRQRSVGLQRAMGASGTRVVTELALEALLVGVAGAGIGLVLAFLLLPQLHPAIGLWSAASRTNLRVDLVTAAMTTASIGLLNVLAIIAPSVLAVRPPPVAALREA